MRGTLRLFYIKYRSLTHRHSSAAVHSLTGYACFVVVEAR